MALMNFKTLPERLVEELSIALSHSLKMAISKKDIPIEISPLIPEIPIYREGLFYKAYEVPIDLKEFLVSRNYIFVRTDKDRFAVYKYNKKMAASLYKTIDSGYFLFKIPNLKKNFRRFLYKILLGLIEQKVKKPETWIEAIFVYLNGDQIYRFKEYKNGIKIEYYSKQTVYYSRNFEVSTEENVVNLEMPESSMNKIDLVVSSSSIEYQKSASSYSTIIKLDEIIQYQEIYNMVFVHTTEYSGLVVLVFE